MRLSGTQSSLGHINGNLMNRKKRPKDLGTDPHGRPGTNRLSTTSTDESIKQNGAEAYGSDRILPGRYDLLRADRCSTNREMLQLDRANTDGSADAEYQYEPYDNEDFSHQPSKGHRLDDVSDSSLDAPDEPRFHPSEESNVYVACASDSDERPAVLHECLAVTAMNPGSKKSSRAVIMFDSGSSFSQVSSKLAHALDLPRTETRVRNVNAFGSKTPMAMNGFRTFLVLRSEQGRSLQVNVTAVNCVVSSVRTALVRDADLPALRRSECIPTPTREMPDILIGQALVHLFNRRLQPTLPCGFYIVRTFMGPMIGGARRSVQPITKATTSSCPPAALPAVEDTDIPDHLRCPPISWLSRTSATTGRLQLRPPDLSLDPPTYSVAGTTDSSRDDLTYSSAYSAGLPYSAAVSLLVNPPTYSVVDTTVTGTKELLEPPSSLQIAPERPSSSQVPGVLPQSTKKQLSPKPLDTQLLLLPTYSSTDGDVEVVPAAYFALTPQRLSQDSLSSTEAELRRSTPPTTTHGDQTSVSFDDARSTIQRKTRLRLCLPECVWQLLGIYTAQEPVTAVKLLASTDVAFTNFPRAELDLQLEPSTKALTSPSPTAARVASKDPDIAENFSRWPLSSLRSKTKPHTDQHRHQPPDMSMELPAYFAVGTTDSFRDVHAYSSAYFALSTAYYVTQECLEASTSILFASGRSSMPPRVPGALPQST